MSSELSVVTWYDDGCKYGDFFHEKNKSYCEARGYDMVRGRDRLCPDRAPHWERIPLLLKHLDNYEYLMWIDGGDVLLNEDRDIGELVPLEQGKHFLFHEDCKAVPKRGGFLKEREGGTAHIIQSGNFIVRGSDYSREVLERWFDLGPECSVRYRKEFGRRFHDQGALRWMLFHDEFDLQSHHSTTMPYGKLSTFMPGNAYMTHFAGPRCKRKMERLYDSENPTSDMVHQ